MCEQNDGDSGKMTIFCHAVPAALHVKTLPEEKTVVVKLGESQPQVLLSWYLNICPTLEVSKDIQLDSKRKK